MVSKGFVSWISLSLVLIVNLFWKYHILIFDKSVFEKFLKFSIHQFFFVKSSMVIFSLCTILLFSEVSDVEEAETEVDL